MMPDTTCSQCREHLAWYVAGRLESDERAAVELHLAGCAACRRKAALWGAIAASLTGKDSHIPPDSHADSAWLALRDRLPRRSLASSQGRKADLLDVDTDSRTSVARHAGPPYQPRRSSRRPVLALAAAVVLVALTVVLFGIFGAQVRQGKNPAAVATSTSASTPCPPSGLAANLPPNATITSISMTSPRNGWAVGFVSDGTSHATSLKTLILHFQNFRWQPFGGSIDSAKLLSVSMGSATDGWALGTTGGESFALHFTGGQWQRLSLPSSVDGSIGGAVRMTSASDGWILANRSKFGTGPNNIVQRSYTLLHYQGGTWTPTLLPFDTSGLLFVRDIAAQAPDDCWITGQQVVGDTADSIVAHYHQGEWTKWTGSQLGVANPSLSALAITASNDVWVAGSYPYKDANGDHVGPLVLHYNGAAWTRGNLGSSGNQGGILTVSALSPTDVWAFPAETTTRDGYTAAQYRAGKWTWTALPGNIAGVTDVAFTSDSEGFGVAAKETQTGGMETILYHYLNGVWSAIPSR